MTTPTPPTPTPGGREVPLVRLYESIQVRLDRIELMLDCVLKLLDDRQAKRLLAAHRAPPASPNDPEPRVEENRRHGERLARAIREVSR